jgi:hypothetical protein
VREGRRSWLSRHHSREPKGLTVTLSASLMYGKLVRGIGIHRDDECSRAGDWGQGWRSGIKLAELRRFGISIRQRERQRLWRQLRRAEVMRRDLQVRARSGLMHFHFHFGCRAGIPLLRYIHGTTRRATARLDVRQRSKDKPRVSDPDRTDKDLRTPL